jgi:hypothetical protein
VRRVVRVINSRLPLQYCNIQFLTRYKPFLVAYGTRNQMIIQQIGSPSAVILSRFRIYVLSSDRHRFRPELPYRSTRGFQRICGDREVVRCRIGDYPLLEHIGRRSESPRRKLRSRWRTPAYCDFCKITCEERYCY